MNIISLGAGVQSSTLAMMAAKGEIGPMPDAAIFADTGWEPKHVHEHLDWLEKHLPFPVYRVMKNDGLKKALLKKGRAASVPFFTANGGMGNRRGCTTEYKIEPIQKKMRELLGYEPRKRIPKDSVTCWIGISLDEIVRMKPSQKPWIKNRHPLIEMGMTRWHCLEWMNKHDYPMPPKSSCLGCPYHSDKHWAEMKYGDQQEWRDTVEMDMHIRTRNPNMKFQEYMHRSLKPIDQIDFSGITNQISMFDDDFGNECEGMCGV